MVFWALSVDSHKVCSRTICSMTSLNQPLAAGGQHCTCFDDVVLLKHAEYLSFYKLCHVKTTQSSSSQQGSSRPLMLDICPVLLQVSRPENGKDVTLKLVVTSKTSAALQLSINISVQAMRHNGTPAANILSEVKEEKLPPWKGDSSSSAVASGPTRSCVWDPNWSPVEDPSHLSPAVSRRTVHLGPGSLLDLLSTHVGL